MRRERRARWVYPVLLALLLFGCGGGGSGGGGGGSAPEPRALRAEGWIGGGDVGWQTGEGAEAGDGLGEFHLPTAAFVDGNGFIYVADTLNHRVCKWAPDGTPVGWIGHALDGWQTTPPPDRSIDPRWLEQLESVFVDGQGNLYVGLYGSIQKWTAEGEFVGWIGGGQDGWQTGPHPKAGSGSRELGSATDLFVTDDGTIYAADYRNARVARWSREGVALGWIGGGQDGWKMGEAPDKAGDLRSFSHVRGIHVNAAGTIYVADGGRATISKWDADGTAIGWIGAGADGWQTRDVELDRPGETGDDLRSFGLPTDVFVTADGDIYVLDSSLDRVSLWSPDGIAQGWIGGATDGWQTGDAEGNGTDGPIEYHSMRHATGVVVDRDGNILVSDFSAARVTKWSAAGVALGWIGGGVDGWQEEFGAPLGSDHRSFEWPTGIALDEDGRIYVVDHKAERVSRWSPDGVALGWIGGGRDGWQTRMAPVLRGNPASFNEPSDVLVDGSGTIYVADAENHRVSRWSAGGIAQGWIGGGAEGWRTDRADWQRDKGKGRRRFNTPLELCLDHRGHLLVGDRGNQRISRWTPEGIPKGWLGDGERGWQQGEGARPGRAKDEFSEGPRGLCVDEDGNIYATDGADRVVSWTASGSPRGWFGGGKDGWQHDRARFYEVGPPDEETTITEAGRTLRKFRNPFSLAMIGPRSILVADTWNDRLVRWHLGGGLDDPRAQGWIGNGLDEWQKGRAAAVGIKALRGFNGPTGLCVDGDGNVYVADAVNDRIVKWVPVEP